MADRPNVNPTPKQEFQSNAQFVKMHREMMQQPMLQVSLQYSLAEYNRKMCDAKTPDGNSAATAFFKVQGVHEFLDVLRKLGEMPEATKTVLSNNRLTQ